MNDNTIIAPLRVGSTVACHPDERPYSTMVEAAEITTFAIGAQLFLSPRTVEWHLGKVFGKLGISSRKELSSALSDIGANGATA